MIRISEPLLVSHLPWIARLPCPHCNAFLARIWPYPCVYSLNLSTRIISSIYSPTRLALVSRSILLLLIPVSDSLRAEVAVQNSEIPETLLLTIAPPCWVATAWRNSWMWTSQFRWSEPTELDIIAFNVRLLLSTVGLAVDGKKGQTWTFRHTGIFIFAFGSFQHPE